MGGGGAIGNLNSHREQGACVGGGGGRQETSTVRKQRGRGCGGETKQAASEVRIVS